MMGDTDLSRYGVDRPALHQMPLLQVSGDVLVAEAAQGRQPGSVMPVCHAPPGAVSRSRINAAQVA